MQGVFESLTPAEQPFQTGVVYDAGGCVPDDFFVPTPEKFNERLIGVNIGAIRSPGNGHGIERLPEYIES